MSLSIQKRRIRRSERSSRRWALLNRSRRSEDQRRQGALRHRRLTRGRDSLTRAHTACYVTDSNLAICPESMRDPLTHLTVCRPNLCERAEEFTKRSGPRRDWSGPVLVRTDAFPKISEDFAICTIAYCTSAAV